MDISENLLLYFSKKQPSSEKEQEGDTDNALSTLQNAFPEFLSVISNKEIIDFGCGIGNQAIAMAKRGAKHVLGIDCNPKWIKKSARTI